MAAVDKSGLVGEQFVMKFGGTVEDSGNHIVRHGARIYTLRIDLFGTATNQQAATCLVTSLQNQNRFMSAPHHAEMGRLGPSPLPAGTLRMRWPEYVQNERMIAPLRTVVRRSLITVKKGSRVNSFVQVTIRGPSWLVIGWSPLLASASDIRDVASNLEQSSNVLLMCMVQGLFCREATLEQYP
ncbi:hypothetical protein BDR05DRAFT_945893 [Suillus weaverae]|nr:hypothetical protein BDR05DRAFT_945893 [Suillus weaverae]